MVKLYSNGHDAKSRRSVDRRLFVFTSNRLDGSFADAAILMGPQPAATTDVRSRLNLAGLVSPALDHVGQYDATDHHDDRENQLD
jgi:hypothetical protein